MKPLTTYFSENIERGVIDFHVRAQKTKSGVEFYIHPLSESGETRDYLIDLDPSNEEFDFIFDKNGIPAPDPEKFLELLRQMEVKG